MTTADPTSRAHSGNGRASTEQQDIAEQLGDFTTTRQVIPISLFAIVIGVLSAFVAWALLKLIGLFTNLFFFQRWDTSLVSPKENTLGIFIIIIPVVGGLIIGLMARFGSERIRGHGIPEAIESILMNGSRVQPRVAVLKPVSSAISIGSGGPFGAEGPIIMTGGAFGSLVAQFFRLTSAERRTLLVAGAAGGMAATFAAPVASVLLAVELLLFEWKPRSLIPVALASVAATMTRYSILGQGPLFPTPLHSDALGIGALFSVAAVGLLAGALSGLLTTGVYATEDLFQRLPVHWMWWPAIGGLFIGIGGYIFPEALGVGYDIIESLLRGDATTSLIVGILLVKSTIWLIALGSGTSGGVLAPLLMMGGALGGLAAMVLPDQGPGFWPLIAMGAILGGTMRSPFTGVVFMLELTHDINMLLPLLLATVIAHGFTVLLLRRSILTEKISRRGYHLSREYTIDPLEILFVREVMRKDVIAIPAEATPGEIEQMLAPADMALGQHLFPIVDESRCLVGVVTNNDLRQRLPVSATGEGQEIGELILRPPVVTYPDEPLRVVVQRMAETGLTRFPVVARGDSAELVGMIGLSDLLQARVRNLEAERRRERVLPARLILPFRTRDAKVTGS